MLVISWADGKGLPLANGSAKIVDVMHAPFNLAIRHEWAKRTTLVRQRAKRLRTPDVFDVDEIRPPLSKLEDPSWTMVFVVATTGLQVSGNV